MAHRHPGKYKSKTPRGGFVYKTRPIHKHSPRKVISKELRDIASTTDKALKIFEAITYLNNDEREKIKEMIQNALISHLIPVYGIIRASFMLCEAAEKRDFLQVLRQWIKLAGNNYG